MPKLIIKTVQVRLPICTNMFAGLYKLFVSKLSQKCLKILLGQQAEPCTRPRTFFLDCLKIDSRFFSKLSWPKETKRTNWDKMANVTWDKMANVFCGVKNDFMPAFLQGELA
jgi:hypothetical protein